MARLQMRCGATQNSDCMKRHSCPAGLHPRGGYETPQMMEHAKAVTEDMVRGASIGLT